MTLSQLRKRLQNIKRYELNICNCVNGPHIDYENDSDGDWVRFDEIEDLLLELEKDFSDEIC